MAALLKKHSLSIIVSLLIVLVLFVTTWLFRSIGIILGMVLLVYGLVATSFMIIKKHREAYLQDKISRIVFVRNVLLEIIGILFTIIVAGILGRYFAELATRQISHDFTRLVLGIATGLVVGIVVGISLKQISFYLARLYPFEHSPEC